MPARQPSKKDLAEQVKRLEEAIRRLGQGSSDSSAGAEGLAEGIVAALGRMVPGLGRLIDLASKMPEFHERLASIDEEIKRRFKEQPLGRASLGIAGSVGRRQMGIPPSARRGRSERSASARVGQGGRPGDRAARGRVRAHRHPKVHISPETPAQLPVDVFDEGRTIVVLAEAPGLDLRDISVCVEDAVLVITIDSAGPARVQRVELPCEVAGEPQVSLTNGVLKVQMDKAAKP